MTNRLFHIFACLLLPLFVAGQITLSDTNFRNCLRSRYPSVLNSGNKLVPAQAANLKGSLVCTNVKITNVDGLEFFTGIELIDLSKNLITSLPDISNLKDLYHLEVAENKLAKLPALSNLKKLKELYAQRNLLTEIPDLSLNDSLTELYIHSNLLDTLPDLSNLKELRLLNVVNNNLKYLPDIDKLTKLRKIICWDNLLKSFPDLSALTELVMLDAAQNRLSQFPKLPPVNKITDLYLNDNQISTLPSLSGYDSLVLAKLHNNNLTINELIKIKSIQGYASKFKIFAQRPLGVGTNKTLHEKEPLQLTTGTDKNISGVYYEWYQNGTLVSTVLNDTFLIANVNFSDSGKYSCLIKHPDLPSFYLQTDSFKITVHPCLDLSKITTLVTGINCLKPGSVLVNGVKPVQQSLTYTLKSPASGKTVSSQTGSFTGLTETDYVLSVQTKYKCERTSGEKIVLTTEPCKEAYLTPNNDGDTDSIAFPQTGKVTIYDKRGQIVKTFAIPSDWDGTAKEGRVAQGYYTADINNGEEVINISVLY